MLCFGKSKEFFILSRPDLIDFDKLKKSNAHYNLQNAFNLAEQHLGLTKLLDPEGKNSCSFNALWALFSHLVRGCCFGIAFCLEEQLAGCCWLTQQYSQRGKERVQDVSCRGLSSGTKTALNAEFIFPHLTRSLDWPCIHKIIPIRGILRGVLWKKCFCFSSWIRRWLTWFSPHSEPFLSVSW